MPAHERATLGCAGRGRAGFELPGWLPGVLVVAFLALVFGGAAEAAPAPGQSPGDASTGSGVQAEPGERTLEKRKRRAASCRPKRPCWYVVKVDYSGEWTDSSTRVSDGRVTNGFTVTTKSRGVTGGNVKVFWKKRRMNVIATGRRPRGILDAKILRSDVQILFDFTPAPGQAPIDPPCIEHNMTTLEAPTATIADFGAFPDGKRTVFGAAFAPVGGAATHIEPAVVCGGGVSSRLGEQIGFDPPLFRYPELRVLAAAVGDVAGGRGATGGGETPGQNLIPSFRLLKTSFRKGRVSTFRKNGTWTPRPWLSKDGSTRASKSVSESFKFKFIPCPRNDRRQCEFVRPVI